MLPLLRRLGGQEPREGYPRGRELPLLHAPRTHRRRGPDHPLELPATHAGHLEQYKCSLDQQR